MFNFSESAISEISFNPLQASVIVLVYVAVDLLSLGDEASRDLI